MTISGHVAVNRQLISPIFLYCLKSAQLEPWEQKARHGKIQPDQGFGPFLALDFASRSFTRMTESDFHISETADLFHLALRLAEAKTSPAHAVRRRASTDRRSRPRVPLDLAFSYRTLGRKVRVGAGRILNISTAGLLASCCDGLVVGTTLELAMEWPIRLNGRRALHQVMIGSVVRSEASRFAMVSF